MEFSSDSPDFAIDEKTGLITVASDLDREVRTTYVVNVTVQDHASPPLTASTTIEIILEDGMHLLISTIYLWCSSALIC